jgi:hypothetical protein
LWGRCSTTWAMPPVLFFAFLNRVFLCCPSWSQTWELKWSFFLLQPSE